MLKKFGLEDSKPMKTPMSTETKLTRDEEGESVDNTKYRGMIGSVLYLTTSRPDIMFSVCLCACFQEDPKTSHLEAVKRIFQYIKGTTHLGLWYPKGSDIETIVYSDSDHAGDYVDRKTTSGVCTFMGCCLTSWFSKKQTILVISTTEAEYVSAKKACQQSLWMKQALVDYGVSDELGVKTGSCKVNAARQNLLLLGERQPSEPQPSSSTTPPSHEEQVTTVASQSQKTHTPRRAKRGRDTKIPQSSGPLKKVGDEVVYTGEDDRVVRAPLLLLAVCGPRCLDTTLEDADAQTRFETASKQSCDPPLSKVNTFGNGEDSMEHQDDLTDFVLPTPYDSPLSGGFLPWKRQRLFKIWRKSLDKENVSKQGRNFKTRSMFVEGDFDDTDDMVNEEMENVEGDTINAGGVVNTATTRVSAARASCEKLRKNDAFKDVEESARSTKILPTIDPKDKGKGIMQEPEKTSKNPRKAQIQMDEELAMRLHEEEKVELERMQEKELHKKKHLMLPLIAEFDDVQARMDADALLAARLQEEEREQFSIDEQARFLVEIIVERKRQDMVDLFRLVKERYEIISLEGYDRLLWGDLITLFESIHVLLMDTGVAIHMMVEKKYPLTQEMLSRMLNRRLEVDHESTMAFELIRFIKAQLEE
ncbi:hypothetical protein Tco_0963373 [Tanacetum coccineum]